MSDMSNRNIPLLRSWNLFSSVNYKHDAPNGAFTHVSLKGFFPIGVDHFSIATTLLLLLLQSADPSILPGYAAEFRRPRTRSSSSGHRRLCSCRCRSPSASRSSHALLSPTSKLAKPDRVTAARLYSRNTFRRSAD